MLGSLKKTNKGWLLFLGFFIATSFYCAIHRQFWWDEGWNTTVATNFLSNGHFGRYSLGEAIEPGLNGSAITVLISAAGIYLFGPGVFSSRLFFLLLFFVVSCLTYRLTKIFSGTLAAKIAIVFLLVSSGHPWINPVAMGVQALGEIPMITFLLFGYLATLNYLKNSNLLWFFVNQNY